LTIQSFLYRIIFYINISKNIILHKSIQFTKLICELYNKLIINYEFTLSKQILKSGTSIGANIHEVQGAESLNDFKHKISIAYKESKETKFWLITLKNSKKISEKEYIYLFDKTDEICRILWSIIKTTQKKS